MIVIKGLNGLKRPIKNSVLAIGVFDGVHLGHRAIIERTVARAGLLDRSHKRGTERRDRFKSIVVTFQPHPGKVLKSGREVLSLISVKHRIKLIGQMGPDMIMVLNFTKAFSELKAADFVKRVLVNRLGVKEIYIGDNFYFGRGGDADGSALASLGRRFGFSVNIVKSIKKHGQVISSSRIRGLILRGQLNEAARLLGRRVSVLGTVVSGAGIARDLGYPTANINPHHEVIPPSGVYAVLVNVDGSIFKGVLNIGTRPTFYGSRDMEPSIEVNILGFNKKIYGKDLELLFIKKLRDEIRFDSRQGLVRQIRKDILEAIKALQDKSFTKI